MIESYKLILGSKSPRRKELLAQLGVKFEVRTKDTDESYPDGLSPTEVAIYISKQKAKALSVDLESNEVVLCSDTIVCLDDEILGKPKDQSEAKEMLFKLSGRTHSVITAVFLTSLEKETSFAVTTEVTFKQLSESEIDYYIEHYNPLDKAGSYGIQEWIGHIGVTTINGSYFNVVGLPTHEVYEALKNFEL